MIIEKVNIVVSNKEILTYIKYNNTIISYLKKLKQNIDNYLKIDNDFLYPLKYLNNQDNYNYEYYFEDINRLGNDINEYTISYDLKNYKHKILPELNINSLYEVYDNYGYDLTDNNIKNTINNILKFINNIINFYKNSNIMYEKIKNKSVSYDDVEILYHVSFFAKSLEENGFDKNIPEPKIRQGIGGFGKSEKISFTYSLKHAKRILKQFKIIWKIVNNQITLNDLKNIAKKLNIYKDVEEFMKSYNPNSEIYNLNYFNAITVAKNSTYQWMAIIGFDNLYKILKNTSYDNLGIIECKVDVTKAEHIPAEYELRVNPESILSTKKII